MVGKSEKQDLLRKEGKEGKKEKEEFIC